MVQLQTIRGWHIHHKERLLYRTTSGSPFIILKFFHYPNYNQDVQIRKFPDRCKVKTKEYNSFFLFNQKLRRKGIISLERTIDVIPTISFDNLSDNWGKISSYSTAIQQKYQESSKFWPLQSSKFQDIAQQDWFKTNDLSNWMQLAHRFISMRINHKQNQSERLGAYQVLQTGIGDCDEFTDLFITLARIRGIPCRRLTGYYIFLKNIKAEPHAWSEILSPNGRWITVDLALNNLGNHTVNYVTLKIEEFNPALPDFHIQTKHVSKVHYQWDQPTPIVTPIY
ncbi:MAG: transglutaminase-like domain-containing protein [Candidatus Hodarchaeota archaeon]